MTGTTLDGFLGGRLTLEQPASGYRAGGDPVMLAAAVPAQSGDRVLDLGCGVGAAMFCLAIRVPGVMLTGVELQADYADLARVNAARNSIAAEIVTGDVSDLPADLRQRHFDRVLMNPPYFDPGKGTRPSDDGRRLAFGDDTPLPVWIDAGLRRLVRGGTLTVIQRAERLPEILAGLDSRVGAVRVLPLQSLPDRTPERVLVHAKKGARAPFRLMAPLVLHDAADARSFRVEIEAVQRDGVSLGVDWR